MAGELAGDGRLWIVGCGPLGPRPALGPFQLQAMANLAVVPGGQATGPVVAGQVAALRAFGGRVGMVVLGADRCLGRELERRYRSVVWTVGHRDGRPVRLGGLPWRGVVADIIRWLTTPPQPPRRYRLPGAPDGLLSSSGRRYPAPAHRPGGRP